MKKPLLKPAVSAILCVLLSPLILIVVSLWLAWTFCLYLVVWTLWCTRGRDILFVYSDSPIWHDYIEEHIIPRIRNRAIILNWSQRRKWLHRFCLSSLLFRHFGGHREFNPMALYFRPFRRRLRFSFWEAFRDWKHGKTQTLNLVENDFFKAIKIQG